MPRRVKQPNPPRPARAKADPGPLRPYNDANPVNGDDPPPRLSAASIARRGRQAEALRLARLTVELMFEQHDECYWCGVIMWHPRRLDTMPSADQDRDNRATFDHKITKSAGGPDTKENGVCACAYCNEHRGNTPFEEYEKWPPT